MQPSLTRLDSDRSTRHETQKVNLRNKRRKVIYEKIKKKKKKQKLKNGVKMESDEKIPMFILLKNVL